MRFLNSFKYFTTDNWVSCGGVSIEFQRFLDSLINFTQTTNIDLSSKKNSLSETEPSSMLNESTSVSSAYSITGAGVCITYSKSSSSLVA